MPTIDLTETADWDPDAQRAGFYVFAKSDLGITDVQKSTRADDNQNSTNLNTAEPESDFELANDTQADASIAKVDQNIGRVISSKMDGKEHSLRLLSLIGIGGMGKVYEAISVTSHEKVRVAVKMAKRSRESAKVIARFDLESSVLQQLQHPNIVKFQADGVFDNGTRFIAMALIEGTQIVEFANRSRLTIAEKVNLFAKVCDAVSYCHEQGIIHRDIKPANILVEDSTQEPILIDFGVVRMMGDDASRNSKQDQPSTLDPSSEGQLVGTIQYMSPEQARRNDSAIDQRTDIYSLGVLLYELLTGHPPISREELRQHSLESIVAKICEEKDPYSVDLTSHHTHGEDGTLLQQLSEIISIAISADADERFGSVSDFKNQLLESVHHSAGFERPTITPRTKASSGTRNSQNRAFGFVQKNIWNAISLCLIVALFWTFRSNSSEEAPAARNSQNEMQLEADVSSQFCDDGATLECREMEIDSLRAPQIQLDPQQIQQSLYVLENVVQQEPLVKRNRQQKLLIPGNNKIQWMIKPTPKRFFVEAEKLEKDVQVHTIQRFNYVVEKLDNRSLTHVKKLIDRIPHNALHKCMFRIGPLDEKSQIRLEY